MRSGLFRRNLFGWERAARIACGLALVVFAVARGGALGVTAGVLGALLVGSGGVGHCPACALAGRREPRWRRRARSQRVAP